MKVFYRKGKGSIVMMVVLAMLLQIVGPVASNVYANGTKDLGSPNSIFSNIMLNVDDLLITDDIEASIEITKDTTIEITYDWIIGDGIEVNNGD